MTITLCMPLYALKHPQPAVNCTPKTPSFNCVAETSFLALNKDHRHCVPEYTFQHFVINLGEIHQSIIELSDQLLSI